MAKGKSPVEMLDQEIDVDISLAQRRDPNAGDADPVIKVTAEPPGFYFVMQITIGHC